LGAARGGRQASPRDDTRGGTVVYRAVIKIGYLAGSHFAEDVLACSCGAIAAAALIGIALTKNADG
jgi:hypothetical protein